MAAARVWHRVGDDGMIGDSMTRDIFSLAGRVAVVTGGYGHSRLGEWVFGGVTHSLLHEPERFVLLSH